MAVAIGFDTSCYTTSIAAVDADGRVLASHRMLLPVQSGQRGLRQSEAVFAHIRQMPLLAEALRGELAGERVCAVAASAAPREGEDSYMPVFLVGLSHARTLAAALNVPFYGTTHQQGHIAAGLIGNATLPEPFVALHLSGGTTDLLRVEGGSIVPLGGSADLHAGQLIDRIGVAMWLPFPAGPALEQLALTGAAASLIPVSMEKGDLRCHLSGAETRAMQWLARDALPKAQIAAEVFDLLARTVARMLLAAAKATEADHALVVGGVASSLLLRAMLENRLQKARAGLSVHFGRPEYSADNAAGVAAIGMRHYLAAQGAADADI